MAMTYAEKARLSNYGIEDDGTLVVKNAWMLWKNFAGAPDPMYHPQGGYRSFTLLLDEDTAQRLSDMGWNVKTKINKNNPEEEPFYTTDVQVNFNCQRPPVFTLYTEFNGCKSQRALDIDELGKIDDGKIRIQRVDLTVSLSRKGGRYLQEMRIIEKPQRSYFNDSDYADYADYTDYSSYEAD